MSAEKLTQLDDGSTEQDSKPLFAHDQDSIIESIEKGHEYDELTTLVPPELRTVKHAEHTLQDPITEVVDEVSPGALWREVRAKNRVGGDGTLPEESSLSELPPQLSKDTRATEWEKQKTPLIPTGAIPTEEAHSEMQRLADHYKATKASQEDEEMQRYRYGKPYERAPSSDGGVFRQLYNRFQHRRNYHRFQKEYGHETSREGAQMALGIVGAALMFADQGKYTKYWKDSTK